MTILHLSDTHFPGGENNGSMLALAKKTKSAIEKYKPDICLHSGDVFNRDGNRGCYGEYRLIWPSFLHVPGNHDNREEMESIFPEMSEGFPYAVQKNGYRFIGLDSSSGEIGKGQRERLSHLLADGKPSFLLLHHQIVPFGNSWMDAHILRDASQLKKLLNRPEHRVSAIFHGHFHFRRCYHIDELPVLSAPSATYQYDPFHKNKTLGPVQGEIGLYHFSHDNFISLHYIQL